MASSIDADESCTSSLLSIDILETTKDPVPLIPIPECYVRVEQETISSSVPLDHTATLPSNVPTIDMIKLLEEQGSDSDDDQDHDHDQLQKLHSTCKGWGIFQLVNHGVSPTLLEKLKHEIEEFFKLPMEEKMKYKVREGETEGYGSVVKAKDQKLDWSNRFYMITNPIRRRRPHLFPELPSSLRNTLESYLMELDQLAMKLVRFMGKALKMETIEIEELFGNDGMQSMRMTYYPPCPKPEMVVGLTPHSDTTGITILNQLLDNGVDGLQIKRDGVWVPVHFQKDAFVVNIGDIFEMMSNGAYRSIEHRVMVNSDKERASVAFFFNPKFEANIGPASSLITPQNPPRFKTVSMEKYVVDFFTRRRLDGKSYLDEMKI